MVQLPTKGRGSLNIKEVNDFLNVLVVCNYKKKENPKQLGSQSVLIFFVKCSINLIFVPQLKLEVV